MIFSPGYRPRLASERGPAGISDPAADDLDRRHSSQSYTFDVRGHVIEFNVYVVVRNSASKVRELESLFQQMPDEHLAQVYPIFVMELKPGGRLGGGTWRPKEVSQFLGRQRRTGIPDEDIRRYTLSRGGGVIGMTRDRWQRTANRLKDTVMHEVGHCIDFTLGLIRQGATEADFAGISPDKCGAGNHVVRRAVEAYARYLCNPDRLINEPLPVGDSTREAERRILENLRTAPAFEVVSTIWWEQT